MGNFIFVQWVVLMKEINYQVRSRTSNHCVSQKRAQIESWVIYHKSNTKNHNNIRIEEILSLCFWDSDLLKNTIFWLGDGTNSNIISYVALRIKIRTLSFQKETKPVRYFRRTWFSKIPTKGQIKESKQNAVQNSRKR